MVAVWVAGPQKHAGTRLNRQRRCLAQQLPCTAEHAAKSPKQHDFTLSRVVEFGADKRPDRRARHCNLARGVVHMAAVSITQHSNLSIMSTTCP